MLSFGVVKNRFSYYYGAGAHVDYDSELVGKTTPYVEIDDLVVAKRAVEVHADLSAIVQPNAVLIGYWRSAVSGIHNISLNQSHI